MRFFQDKMLVTVMTVFCLMAIISPIIPVKAFNEGYLTIYSVDGVEIYIDDNPEPAGVVGQNEEGILYLELKAGEHEIIARREGFFDKSFTKIIVANKPKELHIAYEEADVRTEKIEDTESGLVEQKTGEIRIYSVPVPDATIYINGQKQDKTTNCKFVDFPVGEFELVVERDNGKKLKGSYTLKEDQVMELQANFIKNELIQYYQVRFLLPEEISMKIDGEEITDVNQDFYFVKGQEYRIEIPESRYNRAYNQVWQFDHSGEYELAVEYKPGVKIWSFAAGGEIFNRAVHDRDDNTYFATTAGTLYAVDGKGQELWHYSSEGGINSYPVLDYQDKIYFNTRQKLNVLNKAGEKEWAFLAEEELTGSPAVNPAGIIYISGENTLYAINQDGSLSWQLPVGEELEYITPPVINRDGIIYLGFTEEEKSKVLSVDPVGEIKWEFELDLPGVIKTPPVISPQGGIYFAQVEEGIYALTEDGNEKWTYKTSASITAGPVIANDGLIYFAAGNQVIALDNTGRLLWTFAAKAAVRGGPVLTADGEIYFASDDHAIYALTAEGKLQWKAVAEGKVTAAPLPGGKARLYCGSTDGSLYAFSTGEQKITAGRGWPMTGYNLAGNSCNVIKGDIGIKINNQSNLKLDSAEISYGDIRKMLSLEQENNDIILEDLEYRPGRDQLTIKLFQGKDHNADDQNDKKTLIISETAILRVIPGRENYLILTINSADSVKRETILAPPAPVLRGSYDGKVVELQWTDCGQDVYYNLFRIHKQQTEKINKQPLKETHFNDDNNQALAYQYQVKTLQKQENISSKGSNSYKTAVKIKGISTQEVIEGEKLEFALKTFFPDDGTAGIESESVSYQVDGLPAGALLDENTGEFSWRPGYDQSALFEPVFTARYNELTAKEKVKIKVIDKPQLARIEEMKVKETELIYFKLQVNNNYKNPEELTYRAENLPQGAKLGTDKGIFMWRPDYEQAGNYQLIFMVVNDQHLQDEVTFNIKVKNKDRPPELKEIEDQVVNYDKGVDIKVEAVDPDGDKINYKMEGIPSGARIDKHTGRLHWQPDKGDEGKYRVKIFAVSDEMLATEEFNLTITVPVGDIKWHFDNGSESTFPLTIGDDGTIYLGGHYGDLLALNPDGTEKWTFDAYDNVTDIALAEDGTIYAGNWTNGSRCDIYAVNPDGTEKWHNKTTKGDNGVESLSLDQAGRLYLLYYGDLYIYSPTGRLEKTIDFDFYVWSMAIGRNGTIYLVSGGVLFAYTAEGSQKWRTTVCHDIAGYLTLGEDGTIFCKGRDNNSLSNNTLSAVDPDGKIKWSFKAKDSISSPVIGSDGTLYFSSRDQKLYAVNPDGSKKWIFQIDDNKITLEPPVIGDKGTIYVVSIEYLYAVNPDGSEKWKTEMDFYDPHALYIGDEGTIYVLDRGDIYAVYGDNTGPANSAWPMIDHDLKGTNRQY